MLDSSASRRALGLLVVLAAQLAAPDAGRAQQPPNAEEAYRATIDEAVAEFQAGHWEEARALFKRAHELSPNARTQRGMGKAAFEMRLYVQAIRELEAAQRDTRKPLDAVMLAEVQQLMRKAREFVGRVQLVVEPQAARLLIDGREPVREPDGSVLLDVGTHVISATFEGYKPTNVRLNVEGGSDQIVRVPLEPLLAVQSAVPAIDPNQPAQPAVAPPPEPTPAPAPVAAALPPEAPPPAESSELGTIGWVALAAAVGFGTTAGVLHYAVGDSQYGELEELCGTTCTDRQIADSGIETTDTLTNAFLGLALVSGLTAGVLFAIEAANSGEHDALALEAGPGAVRLRGTF